jgi:hypothetical protein
MWRSSAILPEGTAVGTNSLAAASLPPLYAPWIEEALGGAVPEERHATCSACAMCTPTAATAATASLTVFDPATKCCTYVPTLPNFLVGLVLEDDDPAALAGRVSIERRIAAGTGVTPLGLQPDPHYVLIYKHAGHELFGRTRGLRCPHYLPGDGGQCGIWRHRNAVCATWFCKFERGRVGKRFWDALLQLLTMVERHLGLWAVGELGEPIDGLGPALLPYYATGLPGPASTWSGRWAGRAQEFYRETARLVEPLTWSQVREIGGMELALIAGQLRAAYGAVRAGEVPSHLRLGAVNTVERDGGTVALTGYNTNDMLLLPKPLADSLERFDGRRPTAQVCAEIASQGESQFDQTAVRRLVDFGILVAMPVPGEKGPC